MVKQRENSRWIGERKDSEGRLLCLVPTCNDLREPYKTSNRLKNYCKNHSFSDMRQFTNWQSLRNKVLKRDNNSCVKCKTKETFNSPTYKSNLIADHIIAIALGGDEWDINNIQTLCSKCDKIKTKEDAKKIARLRKVEKSLLNGQTQIMEVVNYDI